MQTNTSTKSLVAFLLILAAGVGLIATTPAMVAHAAEVNTAHDANSGNGNEKSLGTCKQEANNDQACIAKK